MAAGDVDGDVDAVMNTQGTYVVATNDGGRLSMRSVPALMDMGPVELADVDGDGALDLVHHEQWEGRSVSVRRGDGAGGVSTGRTVLLSPVTLTGDLEVHDLEGDGDLDVVATIAYGAVVWRREGSAFAGPYAVDIDPRAQSIAIGDLDGDGRLDVVTDDTVLFGAGAGGLADRHSFLGGLDPLAVDVGGDERDDVVAVSSGNLRVLINELEGRRYPDTPPGAGDGAGQNVP